MKRLMLVLAMAIFLVVGCAGSPLQLKMAGEEGIRSATWQQVFKAYQCELSFGGGRSSEFATMLLDDLVKRYSMTSQEKVDIQNGTIRIGMRKDIMLLAVGKYYRVNISRGSYGTHMQFVFGRGNLYVYTENGKVTSWQRRK